jgi:hypothetical protein
MAGDIAREAAGVPRSSLPPLGFRAAGDRAGHSNGEPARQMLEQRFLIGTRQGLHCGLDFGERAHGAKDSMPAKDTARMGVEFYPPALQGSLSLPLDG